MLRMSWAVSSVSRIPTPNQPAAAAAASQFNLSEDTAGNLLLNHQRQFCYQ